MQIRLRFHLNIFLISTYSLHRLIQILLYKRESRYEMEPIEIQEYRVALDHPAQSAVVQLDWLLSNPSDGLSLAMLHLRASLFKYPRRSGYQCRAPPG